MPELYDVHSSEILFDGPIFAVRRDEIATATGQATRDTVENFSAVAVVPVHEGRVLLIRQYRHSVGRYQWEIPAGLLDKVDEQPLAAARRELAEEAGVAAETWHLLADIVTSPGFSQEMCRIYLAEGIRELDAAGEDSQVDAPADEEADLERRWVPVEEAVRWVQEGIVENAIATAGLLHLAIGTKRDVNTAFDYTSGLAQRRSASAQAAPGADMKGLR
ncbi:NUDIX domain-containing protein [Corynebacterium heidelbergense]|uniref:NTP pyrophosphohydrolase n=1 Tax=Corynebacterium heidelbergense TaxID=2055947 RepID=A0A364V4V9_9CORY|nr:NUDIX hydrolase [Corynebacterium heidelbergense]RAV31657.1 NTP pyrophosphohydrolase [Corynebacterium heidelbergense]